MTNSNDDDKLVDLAKKRAKKQAAAVRPPAVTEDSAALQFTDRYRNELRYDHKAGWYHWSGKLWQHEDTELAFDWARQLARDLAGPSPSKQTAKAAFASGVERRQGRPRLRREAGHLGSGYLAVQHRVRHRRLAHRENKPA
jgi:putative DNA primase/helicase